MQGSIPGKHDLLVHSAAPLNAEPPLARLAAQFLTPTDSLYVRCHGSIPRIQAHAYALTIAGEVTKPLHLSLDDLQTDFATQSIVAALQCAGNRRADLAEVAPILGEPWAPGAIGNIRWTGVRLADVLRAAGAAAHPAMQVAFEALDEIEMDGAKFRYGVSIPMAKALSPEVLLAWAMNDAPLTPEHGFPLRAIVPGYAGVRSPKWLGSITVQGHPATGRFQQTDYRLFPPHVTPAAAPQADGTVINEMPLNAAICEPAAFAQLSRGHLVMRGYAIASGRTVARVDVSRDGGRHWIQAALTHDPQAPWGWSLWQAEIDLPEGEHELSVRAWDSAGQTQPERPDDTWNFKGYLSAAWHRVRVRVG
jgi:sulfite oxidase